VAVQKFQLTTQNVTLTDKSLVFLFLNQAIFIAVLWFL